MDFLRSGLRPSLRKSTVFYHKVTAILILFQLAIAICENIKSLVDTINNFDDCFILFNEPLTTTNSVKAETLICEMVDSFYNKGRFGLLITHFHSIANMNIPSLHVVVNNKDDNLRTYKIENGSASSSYAIDILKKRKLQ